MTRFSPGQIERHAKSHGAAEYAMDLEATMATVGPEPCWEYHPLGLALVDREAVQAQYELMYEHVIPNIISRTERARAYGDDYRLAEQHFRFNWEGHEADMYFTIMVIVDDGYVIGERTYASGILVPVLEKIFDESFRALPGVVDLSSRS